MSEEKQRRAWHGDLRSSFAEIMERCETVSTCRPGNTRSRNTVKMTESPSSLLGDGKIRFRLCGLTGSRYLPVTRSAKFRRPIKRLLLRSGGQFALRQFRACGTPKRNSLLVVERHNSGSPLSAEKLVPRCYYACNRTVLHTAASSFRR